MEIMIYYDFFLPLSNKNYDYGKEKNKYIIFNLENNLTLQKCRLYKKILINFQIKLILKYFLVVRDSFNLITLNYLKTSVFCIMFVLLQ